MAKPLDGLKAQAPKGKDTITLPMHDFFATADQGPFRCGNCEYFNNGKCRNDYVVQHHGPDVEPDDCCDLYEKDED